MGDDEVVLGVHRRLHVVADDAATTGLHRAGIGIGQGNLPVRRSVSSSPSSALSACICSLRAAIFSCSRSRFRLGDRRRLDDRHCRAARGSGDTPSISADAACNLGSGEVAVAVVDRLELAAVDGDHRLGEQVQTADTARRTARQTRRIALPLSLRKSAMVLKSGASRSVSHISSTLRCASRSRRRLDWTRLR